MMCNFFNIHTLKVLLLFCFVNGQPFSNKTQLYQNSLKYEHLGKEKIDCCNKNISNLYQDSYDNIDDKVLFKKTNIKRFNVSNHKNKIKNNLKKFNSDKLTIHYQNFTTKVTKRPKNIRNNDRENSKKILKKAHLLENKAQETEICSNTSEKDATETIEIETTQRNIETVSKNISLEFNIRPNETKHKEIDVQSFVRQLRQFCIQKNINLTILFLVLLILLIILICLTILHMKNCMKVQPQNRFPNEVATVMCNRMELHKPNKYPSANQKYYYHIPSTEKKQLLYYDDGQKYQSQYCEPSKRSPRSKSCLLNSGYQSKFDYVSMNDGCDSKNDFDINKKKFIDTIRSIYEKMSDSLQKMTIDVAPGQMSTICSYAKLTNTSNCFNNKRRTSVGKPHPKTMKSRQTNSKEKKLRTRYQHEENKKLKTHSPITPKETDLLVEKVLLKSIIESKSEYLKMLNELNELKGDFPKRTEFWATCLENKCSLEDIEGFLENQLETNRTPQKDLEYFVQKQLESILQKSERYRTKSPTKKYPKVSFEDRTKNMLQHYNEGDKTNVVQINKVPKEKRVQIRKSRGVRNQTYKSDIKRVLQKPIVCPNISTTSCSVFGVPIIKFKSTMMNSR